MIDDKGMVGKKGDMELGGDVVRMVQASVSMDIGMAVALRDWLAEHEHSVPRHVLGISDNVF